MNSETAYDILQYLAHVSDLRPLQSKKEQDAASALVESLGFPSHHDAQKNWDTFKCLSYVTALNDRASPVLDAGSGSKCVVLHWLSRLGYKSLHACDLQPTRTDKLEPLGISFTVQDITKTSYPDSYFQAATSISVIEHNVPLEGFAREMMRVLKPGGVLAVSTDYWPEPIDCSEIYPYGVEAGEMKIFNRQTLSEFVAIAQAAGFEVFGAPTYDAPEKCVRWERVDRDYTFAFLAFRKPG